MDLSFKDMMLLFHPAIAIVVFSPLLGIVINYALLVRRRRQSRKKSRT